MKNILLVILVLLNIPLISQSFYAESVVSYSQGLTSNGNPVPSIRSNTLNCLGQPQGSDVEVGILNFYSLGFGGYITLKTDVPVLVNPLSQLQIFETTYSYNCAYYPEKAMIFVSKDNQSFEFIGETCGNDNTIFSLYQKIDTINYIKIKDCSDPSKFANFVNADAYDLDGVEIFNLTPLSIELDFFNANIENENLYFRFRTLSESGTLRFYIQSSKDAIIFKDLGIFLYGANYSIFPREYSGSINYNQTENVEYVRLKEEDINGDFLYFDPVAVTKKSKDANIPLFYDLLGRRNNCGDFLIKY